MAKCSPGQLAGDSPLGSAAFINNVVDVVSWYNAQVALGNITPDETSFADTNQIKVRNLVGGDLDQGDCVQLGEYLLTTFDPRRLWFEGNEVADPAANKWAICVSAIKSGEIGPAQVSGSCSAKINVTSTSHTHANPVSGETALASGDSGPIEILSPVTETGEQLLAVRLGGGGGGAESTNCPAVIPGIGNLGDELPTFSVTKGTLSDYLVFGLQISTGCWGKIPLVDGCCDDEGDG